MLVSIMKTSLGEHDSIIWQYSVTCELVAAIQYWNPKKRLSSILVQITFKLDALKGWLKVKFQLTTTQNETF